MRLNDDTSFFFLARELVKKMEDWSTGALTILSRKHLVVQDAVNDAESVTRLLAMNRAVAIRNIRQNP